jgi:hypothetical protein
MTKRKKGSKAAADLVRIRWDSMTPEERSEQARKRWQNVPEEERRRRTAKARKARHAKWRRSKRFVGLKSATTKNATTSHAFKLVLMLAPNAQAAAVMLASVDRISRIQTAPVSFIARASNAKASKQSSRQSSSETGGSDLSWRAITAPS